MKANVPIVRTSSGNVFADLRVRGSGEVSIQAELARVIYLRVKELGLTQAQTAERLGLRQPDVSKLMNGRHTGFSAERLFRLLNALGQDIRIVVKRRPARSARRGSVHVVAA